MRILLTGANGQVGHEIHALAPEMGFKILALTRDELDVTDLAAVHQRIANSEVDLVINASAYTAVDRAEEERDLAFSVNRDAVAYLAKACADADLPLLHISTDYVFDGSQKDAYREGTETQPLGVYGESKWQGEELLRETLPRHVILRTAWVFGAHGHNFVKTMLRLGEKLDHLRVVADQRGGPTSAHGIAEGLLRLAQRYRDDGDLEWGTYHFSGQPYTSWHGFANEIFARAVSADLLEKAPVVDAITTDEYPTPAKRPANSCLDSSRIREMYGIEADDWRVRLDEILKAI